MTYFVICGLFVQAKETLSGSSYCDYLVFSRAVLGWRQLQQQGDRDERDEYLDKHTLSKTGLRFINGKIEAGASQTLGLKWLKQMI